MNTDEEAFRHNLSTLVERTKAKLKVEDGVLDAREALYDPAIPWAVKGWLTYWLASPYERLCLRNAGMIPPRIRAQYDGETVLLVTVQDGWIGVNPQQDPQGAVTRVSYRDLSEWRIG